jgi:holo-[acyl-carrier protein] synthase
MSDEEMPVVGIDLVDLDRIAHAWQVHGGHFGRRICTQAELDYCLAHSDPVPFLAARFAAKEAVSKALGTGIGPQCSFLDIEVIHLESGAPQLRLVGGALELSQQLGVSSWSISLTHSATAAAVVVFGV